MNVNLQSISIENLKLENRRLQKRVLDKDANLVELDKELKEARELIVAFVTGNGEMIFNGKGGRTHRLFLDDRDVANVAHDDVLSVTYDNQRCGNVYEVAR